MNVKETMDFFETIENAAEESLSAVKTLRDNFLEEFVGREGLSGVALVEVVPCHEDLLDYWGSGWAYLVSDRDISGFYLRVERVQGVFVVSKQNDRSIPLKDWDPEARVFSAPPWVAPDRDLDD